MQRHKILFAILALLGLPNLMLGQGIMGGSISPQEKEAFKQRVKGIEQFISRFNYAEGLQNNKQEGAQADSLFVEGRKRSIVYLLDYLKYSKASEQETQQLEQFISYVNKGDSTAHFLDFYDKGWYAVVSTKATFRGQPVTVSLTLQNEVVGDRRSKWVVVGAKAPFLKLEATDPSVFLPPNASGTNFMELSEAMEDPQNAVAYANTQFQADPLTLFFAYMQLGLLKVESVEEVAFHFLQLQGWGMVVEEYNRLGTANSGWLISQVFPLLNKAAYLQDTLGLPPKG